jgi:hypothetical protein
MTGNNEVKGIDIKRDTFLDESYKKELDVIGYC